MSSGSKKVIYAAMIGNTLIAITKFAAAAFTGSSAMLSEGIHSLVDTGNQVLLLYGLKKSQKAPDARFPFGYGKEVYFWSFIVAILIFAVGSGVSLYEGFQHIIHPKEMSSAYINYLVLGFAMLFEGGALVIALKEFNKVKGPVGYIEAVQRGKDPSMFVVLFEDSAAMLGLVVALIGITVAQLTGEPVWDGVASVIIGLILGGTAIWLAYETKGLLIGEGAGSKTVEGIKELITKEENIEKTNEVLTLHMGPDFILVNISVTFKRGLQTGVIEQTIQHIDEQIKSLFPHVKRVFIEAENSIISTTAPSIQP